MRIRFDEQLELLNRKLIEMGALRGCDLRFHAHAEKRSRQKSAEKAAAPSARSTTRSAEIESLCMKLLLQQQPVARPAHDLLGS